jgi:hypothetical protein
LEEGEPTLHIEKIKDKGRHFAIASYGTSSKYIMKNNDVRKFTDKSIQVIGIVPFTFSNLHPILEHVRMAKKWI